MGCATRPSSSPGCRWARQWRATSLALIVQWPITLAALAIELVLIVWLTGWLLRKLFGLDRGTAYLSSFPGHLSFVMSIAAAGVGDARQIVIIQVIRILLLTICVPIGALFLPVGHYEGRAGAGRADEVRDAGAGGHRLWHRRASSSPSSRCPPAMCSAPWRPRSSPSSPGWFEGRCRRSCWSACSSSVGALIGSRFVGITMKEFLKAVAAGLAGTALTVAISHGCGARGDAVRRHAVRADLAGAVAGRARGHGRARASRWGSIPRSSRRTM